MKKLNLLKKKFAKERLSKMQAIQLKGGDDKRMPRPTDPKPIPGGLGGLTVTMSSNSIGVTVSIDS